MSTIPGILGAFANIEPLAQKAGEEFVRAGHTNVDQTILFLSIAISLKRIADCTQRQLDLL